MKLFLTSVAEKTIGKAIQFFPKKPQDSNIVCIFTASKVEKEPREWLDLELNEFRRLDFNLDMFDIDGQTEDQVSSKIEKADIVYVTGGNTFFLLEKMKACSFEKIIRKALDRGIIYIGSSAGSVICCPDIDYVRTMDDPSIANLDDTKGLNLIDFFVMVHMDKSSFAEKANEKILTMKHGIHTTICLNDNQALFVDGRSISLI